MIHSTSKFHRSFTHPKNVAEFSSTADKNYNEFSDWLSVAKYDHEWLGYLCMRSNATKLSEQK